MRDKKKIKVIVCDDSALIRVTIVKILEKDEEIEICGVARNGEELLEKARKLRPDVITLDVEMPVKDGIETLKEIVKEELAPTIMFSALTQSGAEKTLEAMEIGAFDCLGKPDGSFDLKGKGAIIIDSVKKAASSNIYRKIGSFGRQKETANVEKKSLSSDKFEAKRKNIVVSSGFPFKVVALGISTGGPKTIMEVLPLLPEGLNAAVVVVQHMPPTYISSYAKRINTRTKIPCLESEAGMELEAGKIYIAKGGKQFKLIKRGRKAIIRHSDEPKHVFTPSVDVMMDSVSSVFKGDTIGVIMTGMGKDGAQGMGKIYSYGGPTIAESEESAIVYGMPQEVVKRGLVDSVLPSWMVADEIVRVVNK